MNALELRHLSKSYPGFQLRDFNLTLPQGCIMGLIGENGAGKSTAIKLILDIVRKDSGTVTVLGRDHSELTLMKEDIGVVLDEVGIPSALTARQVGKIMSGIYRQWDMPKYQALLSQLRVPDNKAFQNLSRGMKMKVGIAIALSHNAKLLILDEATSGLDPVVRDEVVEMLMDFTRDAQHSILISSHIVSDLEKLCDYVAFLHRGELLLCEEKDRLLDAYCFVQGTTDQLDSLPSSAVRGRRVTPYGTTAIVQRSQVPVSWKTGPVSIEELFVFMVKEDR